MKLITEVQNCCGVEALSSSDCFQQWADCLVTNPGDGNSLIADRATQSATAQLAEQGAFGERQVFIRLVGKKEMRDLNGKWRGKLQPTNVLAFPAGDMPGVDNYPIGDIVICVEVVQSEADEQGKPFVDRMAHIFIHGLLHLLGFDHQAPEQAAKMERIEEEALTILGYAKPYEVS